MKTLKKIPLLPTVALFGGILALGGCASSEKDEPSGVALDNRISFSPVTERTSRDGDLTTANLSTFNVYAYLNDHDPANPYMSNVTVNKDGTAWVYSPVQYWPEANLSFFAYAPASFVPSTSNPLAAIPYHNGGGREDLIYAAAVDQSQPLASGSGQVMLNFRHALSKIDVMLSSGSDDFIVKVAQVMIVGVNMDGEFKFPLATTSGAANEKNTGTWSNLSYQYAYTLHWAQSQDEVLQLTTTPVNANNGYFAQYMIPQPLTWKNGGDLADDYIQLNVSIYDKETGAKVWPNAATSDDQLIDGSTNNDGKIKFPLSTSSFSAWQPGYHYIYNIVVNSHPDLQPIEFGTPTVDGFVKVETNYEF